MYADAEHTLLEVELPTFDEPVLYEVQRDGDNSSSQHQTVHKPLDWFLTRMSDAERARLDKLMTGRGWDLA